MVLRIANSIPTGRNGIKTYTTTIVSSLSLHSVSSPFRLVGLGELSRAYRCGSWILWGAPRGRGTPVMQKFWVSELFNLFLSIGRQLPLESGSHRTQRRRTVLVFSSPLHMTPALHMGDPLPNTIRFFRTLPPASRLRNSSQGGEVIYTRRPSL